MWKWGHEPPDLAPELNKSTCRRVAGITNAARGGCRTLQNEGHARERLEYLPNRDGVSRKRRHASLTDTTYGTICGGLETGWKIAYLT